MTEQEVIEVLNELGGFCSSEDNYKACQIANKALEEIQQYHAIGTVEECLAAVEKQKAKICSVSGDGYADGYLVYDTYECPNCGKEYEIDYDRYEYCPNCGQHMLVEFDV